ncbi:MAG: TMAO reductase system periplasmic protein TorT [Pseudomonadaceae bacterium]|mgnify:CR=1 FL=1|nr:TMAO reductase system periplasmic protein TorT [Pseudomonadaceae bacterium]
MRIAKSWLLCLCCVIVPAQADWFPLPVRADGELTEYRPLLRASQAWRICALLPHGKDRYWWGVAWGLDGEASRQGVRLGIYEAGGYENPQVQVQQLHNCRGLGADAYVIASINTGELCPEISRLLAEGRPVIDLANGLDCKGLTVTAHSRVDFADMAREALGYIEARRAPGAYRLGWLPGPQGAGWVRDAERGLQQVVSAADIRLAHGGYGPVDRSSQARLVRRLLREQPHLDYLLGNAEAAGFAAQLVLGAGEHRGTQVLAFYVTERIIEQIREGFILAAPSDSPVHQARIAIDFAVRALERQPHPREVGPLIEMLDRDALESFDISRLMPPEGHWMIRRDLPE